MGLSFDVTKIKDWENVCYHEVDGKRQLHPVTHVIVLSTPSIGIGRINSKNVEEFTKRTMVWQKCFGGALYIPSTGENRGLTPEEILAHVGLWTNVMDDSMSVFRKRVYDALMWDAQREIAQWWAAKDSVDA